MNSCERPPPNDRFHVAVAREPIALAATLANIPAATRRAPLASPHLPVASEPQPAALRRMGPSQVIFLKTLCVIFVGIFIGLVATYYAVERGVGFGAVHAGPWTGFPKSGSSDADPYARAVVSRTAEIPLGLAEGLTFIAQIDERGEKLDPRCDYTVRGPVPVARDWTMMLTDPQGALIDNDARFYGFTSAAILRTEDGAFTITISRAARPGNWLPLGQAKEFEIVLHLYDTPVSATAAALDGAAMPSITRGRCA